MTKYSESGMGEGWDRVLGLGKHRHERIISGADAPPVVTDSVIELGKVVAARKAETEQTTQNPLEKE